MVTKRSLSFFALMMPLICIGQDIEIKLSCQLTLVNSYISGLKERSTVEEILEVTQYKRPEYLAIIPVSDSGSLASVTTGKTSNIISVQNYSDDNKWSLTNTVKSSQGFAATTSITIDRNSGKIFYFRDFRNGQLVIEGQGNCKKVDTTKKLF
jgi:hypothetical protein